MQIVGERVFRLLIIVHLPPLCLEETLCRAVEPNPPDAQLATAHIAAAAFVAHSWDGPAWGGGCIMKFGLLYGQKKTVKISISFYREFPRKFGLFGFHIV